MSHTVGVGYESLYDVVKRRGDGGRGGAAVEEAGVHLRRGEEAMHQEQHRSLLHQKQPPRRAPVWHLPVEPRHGVADGGALPFRGPSRRATTRHLPCEPRRGPSLVSPAPDV